MLKNKEKGDFMKERILASAPLFKLKIMLASPEMRNFVLACEELAAREEREAYEAMKRYIDHKDNILSGKTAEEPLGFCSRMVGGMAMIPVKKGEACFRMNCNDMEFDDDFSDLVFDVRFTETETKEEWEKLAKTPSAYEIKMYEPPKPQ